jgi:addiction module RelE/StbE family toxin
MRLRYTRLALADLEEAHAFIRAENPRAAKAVMARIREAVERLVRFPDAGRPGRIAGTRELIVAGSPFVVAYRVTAETVDVLAVIHASRRWPSSFA